MIQRIELFDIVIGRGLQLEAKAATCILRTMRIMISRAAGQAPLSAHDKNLNLDTRPKHYNAQHDNGNDNDNDNDIIPFPCPGPGSNPFQYLLLFLTFVLVITFVLVLIQGQVLN